MELQYKKVGDYYFPDIELSEQSHYPVGSTNGGFRSSEHMREKPSPVFRRSTQQNNGRKSKSNLSTKSKYTNTIILR